MGLIGQYILSFAIVIVGIGIWVGLAHLISENEDDMPKSIVVAAIGLFVLAVMTYIVHDIIY